MRAVWTSKYRNNDNMILLGPDSRQRTTTFSTSDIHAIYHIDFSKCVMLKCCIVNWFSGIAAKTRVFCRKYKFYFQRRRAPAIHYYYKSACIHFFFWFNVKTFGGLLWICTKLYCVSNAIFRKCSAETCAWYHYCYHDYYHCFWRIKKRGRTSEHRDRSAEMACIYRCYLLYNNNSLLCWRGEKPWWHKT